MKHIPLVTVLLWISSVMGYVFAKDIFILPLVKFPTLILLSICLPVSFWTLQAKKKRLYAFAFIGIFIINNAILVYGLISNYSTLESLLNYTEKKIDPELAKLLVSGNSEKERSVVGRLIFQKHGITLPFKTHDDLFVLYTPTQADKDLFIANHDRNYRIILAQQNLSNQIVTTFFLITLQVTIFFILLIYLILFDRPSQTAVSKVRALTE